MATAKSRWRSACLFLTLALASISSVSCSGYAVTSKGAGAEEQGAVHNRELVLAVQQGNLVQVRRLLEQGANPNTVNERGCTLLQLMTTRDPIPMLELLYEFKVDLNLAGCDSQWGPLESSVHSAADGDKDAQSMVTWLLQHGARVNNTTVSSGELLAQAFSHHSTTVLEQLLAAGADPNRAGSDGDIPLIIAISFGDAPTELLLSHGANPNIYDDRGWSPLLEAVELNDARKVKLLLQHGADVNHGDRDGWTAYDQALLQGCPEIIAELEKAGATQ